MVSESTKRSWGPRLLAPVAFFAAATTLVLVIHRSLTADTAATPTPTGATETAGTAGTGTGTGATETETTQGGQGRRRFYRVRSGDFLETIAQRFDTTVGDLLELNPNLDPNSLQPGQRIRVR